MRSGRASSSLSSVSSQRVLKWYREPNHFWCQNDLGLQILSIYAGDCDETPIVSEPNSARAGCRMARARGVRG